VNIAPLASWTGLGAGLVVLAVLEGCATTTSDQDMRRAALWAAATECASGKASLKVERIDNDGRVHVKLFQGGQQNVPAFNACYNRKAQEKLVAAERAGSPARIVESRSAPEPSVVRSPSRVTSVTIHTVDHKILVPVVLNENQTATFLLDTGANITVITPTLARRLGVERLSGEPKTKARIASGQEVEVSLICVKSIGVGSARIDNFGVVVYDLPPLVPGTTPPITVDGLLGADFITRFTMTVDPRAGTLSLQLDDRPMK
jgi:predicted aspartyl protease